MYFLWERYRRSSQDLRLDDDSGRSTRGLDGGWSHAAEFLNLDVLRLELEVFEARLTLRS